MLAAFCAERGRTILELAFGWLLARPYVASVTAGATAPGQVRLNADALGWQLTATISPRSIGSPKIRRSWTSQ
jgi:aryl-alcohol dehydrogenase-like predicted oxidoreductase